MENYSIPKKLIQGIIDYLTTRPYKEVAAGLEELAGVIRAQENQAVQVAETEETEK